MSGETRPAPGEIPPGAQIAGYRIEELIGRGGMAVVYRATDVRLERTVALKILAPELARDDSFRQRFIRESRSGAAVDHPNVIPVFEAGETDGVLFIAMRYVTGGDVRALIEHNGALQAKRTISVVTQVASALDAAHAHGLIHRDVKPANMLLASVGDASKADHVYLSDFGLSKQTTTTSSLTGTGQFLGTLDYMAPEQVEGRPIDGRTDLYALACAAFEMLTGEPPFRREQNLAVMWAHVSAPPPSIRQLRPDLPAAVDQVFSTALAKSPEDRQRTCLEFADALRVACRVEARAARPAPVKTELASVAPPLPAPAHPTVTDLAEQAAPVADTAPLGAAGVPAGYGATADYQPSAGQGAGRSAPVRGGYSPVPGAPGYKPSSRRTDPRPDNAPGAPGYPPERRRGRGLLIGVVVAIVLGLGAGAGIALLSHHKAPKPIPTTTITVTPTTGSSGSSSPSGSASASADTVVTNFINAINNRDYQTAWNLEQSVHSTETYAQFEQGYSTTQQDTLTITGTNGDIVSVEITAQQTDGSVKYFTGTYTVQNGVIVGSHILQR